MISRLALASAALLALAACNGGGTGGDATKADGKAIAAPAGKSWAETTSTTSYGGFVMGNPDAPVKLAEYGAMSCSHCAEFSESSSTELRALIEKGTVSYEFRPFLLGPVDVPASILARCGGPGPFFPIAEQMFKAQADWLGKTSSISEAEQKSWAGLKPTDLAAAIAAKLELDVFVQQRGISSDKVKACLADGKAIDELLRISQVGQQEFKVSGTPTFILNGTTVENVTTWEALKPKLFAAGA